MTTTIPGPFSKQVYFCKLGQFQCTHICYDSTHSLDACNHPEARGTLMYHDFSTPLECPLKPKNDPYEEPQP